jgi:hypothetical protein
MAHTIKLRPESGYRPWEEIDLTDRCMLSEMPPKDLDSIETNPRGEEVRARRAIRRRIKLSMQRLSTAEVNRLRHWKHNRVRIAFNPNWNAQTTLLSRFARYDDVTLSPGAMIGPAPTFTRTISNSSAYATEKNFDSTYHGLSQNVPRYEYSNVLSTFYPMRGVRLCGATTNYFGKSYPQSGTLLWTLTNTTGTASWSWSSTLPAFLDDLGPGAGLFSGGLTDYLSQTITSYGGSGNVSIGVWVMGEGTCSIQVTGGGTGEGSSLTLSSSQWQLVKLENQSVNGSSLTIRLNAKSSSWMAVGGAMFQRDRRVTNYLHNLATTSAVTLQEDAILYSGYQFPFFGTTLHVVLEPSDLVASGEQCVLGVDATAGNRLVLKYDAALAKFYFQRKSSGVNVQWTPQRGANRATVISIFAGKDSILAFENGVFVASATGAIQTIPAGLNVGWDGITDTQGWNGLVYALRIDQGGLDTTEIEYVSDRYNDADMIEWTRLGEGRLFRIVSPDHRIRAAAHFSEIELEEVYSHRPSTTEEP